MKADFSIDDIRIFLHVLAVCVWVGGQIVMLSILPVLRKSSVEGLSVSVAQAFQRVAWPAFGLAVFTGIWNIMSVDMGNAEPSYNAVFGIKFLLVLLSGVAALVHAKSAKPSIKGMTGALGFLSALGAMILGYALT